MTWSPYLFTALSMIICSKVYASKEHQCASSSSSSVEGNPPRLENKERRGEGGEKSAAAAAAQNTHTHSPHCVLTKSRLVAPSSASVESCLFVSFHASAVLTI